MMPYTPHEEPIEESKYPYNCWRKKKLRDPKYNPFEPSQPELKIYK